MTDSVTVIGAGPAGSTETCELVRHVVRPILLEKAHKVGRIARSECHDGFRFDIVGQRFFSRDPEVDHGYQRQRRTIRAFLSTIDNLRTIGQNSVHRYNNMDHSMRTGLLAARNLLGENHDRWGVNPEGSHGEESAPG